VTEIESVVKPYCVLNDFGKKSISLVDFRIIHSTIVAELQLTGQYPALPWTSRFVVNIADM
jgi:hypothetical protein